MFVVSFPTLWCWNQMLLVSHEIIVSVKILHHKIHPQPFSGKYSTLSSPCPGAMLLLCLLVVLSLCLWFYTSSFYLPWLWSSLSLSGWRHLPFLCEDFFVAASPPWEQAGKPVGVIWSVRPLCKEPQVKWDVYCKHFQLVSQERLAPVGVRPRAWCNTAGEGLQQWQTAQHLAAWLQRSQRGHKMSFKHIPGGKEQQQGQDGGRLWTDLLV